MNTAAETDFLPPRVRLGFELQKRDVLLSMTPDPKGEPLSARQLRQHLADTPFGDFFLQRETLDEILAVTEIEAPLHFKLAEKRDCDVKIEVSTDEMEAYLTVKPSYGGATPEPALLNLALKGAQIQYGLQAQALEEISVKGKTDSATLIARGDAPEHGQDTKFEYLITSEGQAGKPKILEDGRVDFSELNIVTSVAVGTALMRKVPATEGKPGRNVRGQFILQVKGKEKAFGVGKGSAIDETDPNLLKAAVAGQVKPRPNTVNVEPIFETETINQETGNVAFAGTIKVRGPIASGYKVQAEGDLLVEGAVEAMEIQAGGNILFESGVIGKERGVIRCQGYLTARFVEGCTVETRQKVQVVDSIVNSHIVCFDNVEVGQPQGRGQIIGGKTCAYHAITARIAGSSGGIQTFLQVGIHPALQAELKKLRTELEGHKKKFDETLKAVIYYKTHKGTPQQISELEKQKEELLYAINLLNEETQLLRHKMEEDSQGGHFIHITDRIYAGTVLNIAGHNRIFSQDAEGGRFILEKGLIVLGASSGIALGCPPASILLRCLQ